MPCQHCPHACDARSSSAVVQRNSRLLHFTYTMWPFIKTFTATPTACRFARALWTTAHVQTPRTTTAATACSARAITCLQVRAYAIWFAAVQCGTGRDGTGAKGVCMMTCHTVPAAQAQPQA